MRTKAGALVLLVCALWSLSGCQTQRARQQDQRARQYTVDLHSVMRQYADAAAADARRPRPSASLPRSARRAILADRILDTSRLDARLASRLRALKPPPGQERVLATMVDMFQSTSVEYPRWAEAVRSGNIKAADREYDRVGRIQAHAMNVLKALGVKFPAWARDVLP